MKYLINRDKYINECIRFCGKIEKNGENDNELYEGLLSTMFGGLKMLFNKDWASISCKNPSVLTHLKAIDKTLTGYTMVKMQFSNECNIVRQNIADYFNDILKFKLDQVDKLETEEDIDKFIESEKKERVEVEKKDPDAKNIEEKESMGNNFVSKLLNLKDKVLLDNIKKYKDNIKIACKQSPKLKEYADQMLNTIIVFVNDIVIQELEKKGADKVKLEEEKKRVEENKKKLEDARKKMDELAKKGDEETLKKLSADRDKAMRNLGVKPIGAMNGDKSIDTIFKQFNDMLGEFNNIKLNESALPKGYDEVLRSDTYIGIQKSLEELNWNFSDGEKNSPNGLYDKFFIRVILNKIKTVYEVVAKSKSKFKEVPSVSIQAMMIALSNAIIYGFMGKEFDIEKNNARLSLMTKCAIDSDATIGFNLPLIDPKKPENGNYFVSIMNQFKNENISSKEVEDAAKSLSNEEIKDIMKALEKNGKNDKDMPVEPVEFAKELGPMIMKDFRQNMAKLFDIIVNKAKELKEKAAKERENEVKKLEQEAESEDKNK